MKLLADECCNSGTVEYLRKEGFDVKYVPEIDRGSSDSKVLQIAYEEQRVLLTIDKDVGNLVYRLKKPAFGIILLRFHPLDQDQKLTQLRKLTTDYSKKIKGNFIVVDSNKIRIRPLHTG